MSEKSVPLPRKKTPWFESVETIFCRAQPTSQMQKKKIHCHVFSPESTPSGAWTKRRLVQKTWFSFHPGEPELSLHQKKQTSTGNFESSHFPIHKWIFRPTLTSLRSNQDQNSIIYLLPRDSLSLINCSKFIEVFHKWNDSAVRPTLLTLINCTFDGLF